MCGYVFARCRTRHGARFTYIFQGPNYGANKAAADKAQEEQKSKENKTEQKLPKFKLPKPVATPDAKKGLPPGKDSALLSPHAKGKVYLCYFLYLQLSGADTVEPPANKGEASEQEADDNEKSGPYVAPINKQSDKSKLNSICIHAVISRGAELGTARK